MFTRRLGVSGLIVTLDRTVPYLNTPGNPEQNAEIYVFRAPDQLTQVTSTPRSLIQGAFDPGFANLSYDESAVVFASGHDLTGDNPTNDLQLFRYDIESGQIFQVTRFRSAARDLFFASGRNADERFAFQINPIGMSADARVIQIAASQGTARAVRTADGIRVIRFSEPVFVCE